MIGMGTYYAIYIFGNENLFGVFSWAINIPLILALIFTPMLVAKWHGMYKLNVMSYGLATISRALVAVAGFMGASGNVGLMLLFTAIAALGQGPWQGDMNAVIAACSEYTWLTRAQARGWHHVLLHFPWCQAGRRHRHCHYRLAAGRQRFRQRPWLFSRTPASICLKSCTSSFRLCWMPSSPLSFLV